jgi:hypothetical protein
MNIFTFSIDDGVHSLKAVSVICGDDLCVALTGGTKPHIGASALGIPRASLKDPNTLSSSVSVICVTGHKDDELAREAALTLASKCNCTVNVSVGIHIPCADYKDIQRINDNFKLLLHKMMDHQELLQALMVSSF